MFRAFKWNLRFRAVLQPLELIRESAPAKSAR